MMMESSAVNTYHWAKHSSEMYLGAGEGASTFGTVHSGSIIGEYSPLISWKITEK